MAQTFYPITPVNRAHATDGSYEDVDCSADAPEGATGVVVHIVNTVGSDNVVNLRKNGSTDAYHAGCTVRRNTHLWAMVGVDASRIFEAYLSDASDIELWIVGYTVAGVTFNTNYDTLNMTTTAWEDWDVSTEAPGAIAIILEMWSTGAGYWAARKNGSTDDRSGFATFERYWIIIGCDGSQNIDLYTDNTAEDWRIVGYVTDGVTMHTNATDRSLGATTTWTDLGALGANAVMGFYEIASSGAYEYGFRENGSEENIHKDLLYHACAFVESASQIVEGYIENTGCDFFELGSAKEVVAGWSNIASLRQGTGEVASADIANIRMGTGSIAVADIYSIWYGTTEIPV